eukprot:GEMP01007962.1.p1 GENE.GEMP01007962.1~~GEMP01007962.1.p1  ORF type:complete len:529 (+),score=121.51 GEMP01007962.1:55-1641(+)
MSSKRAALTTTSTGNDAKKSKPEKKCPLQTNLDILSDAFNNAAYEFPCRQDLRQILITTMATPVEERHEFQTQAFGMVEEAIREGNRTLETRRADLESQVSRDNELNDIMEKDLDNTTDAIKKTDVGIEALDISTDEATHRLEDSANSLKAEELALKEASVEYEKHQADYEELDTAFVNLYSRGVEEFIDEDTQPAHKKALEQVLNKLITLPENETTVLGSVFPALYKVPSTRTKFDTLTLNSMEDHIENTLFAIKKMVEATKPDFSKRDGLVQEVARLTQELDDERNKMHVAKATKKELLTKHTSIEKNLKNHPKKVKHTQLELVEVAKTIECFNTTVVPANKFLQEYTEEVIPLKQITVMGVKEQPEETEDEYVNAHGQETIAQKGDNVMEQPQQEMLCSDAPLGPEKKEIAIEIFCQMPKEEPAFEEQIPDEMQPDSEEDTIENEQRFAGVNSYENSAPVGQGAFHGGVERQAEFGGDQMSIDMDIDNPMENTPARNALDSPQDTIKSTQGSLNIDTPASVRLLW